MPMELAHLLRRLAYLKRGGEREKLSLTLLMASIVLLISLTGKLHPRRLVKKLAAEQIYLLVAGSIQVKTAPRLHETSEYRNQDILEKLT